MTDWEAQWRDNGERFNVWPNEELVRWASTLERGSRVLEVGCGSGANLWALESAGMDAWGVDVAEEALRRSEDASWASQVKLTSACELTFPDESFDAVCDVQCFQHLAQDELPLAYKEAARVLKPGGRFFEVFLTAGQENFPELTFCQWRPMVACKPFGEVKQGQVKRWDDRRFYEYSVWKGVK